MAENTSHRSLPHDLDPHTVDLTKRNEIAPGAVTRVAHADYTWVPLVLVGAWSATANTPTPAYCVDNEGIVHFRGAVQGGASGSTFSNIPASISPPGNVVNLHIVCGASTSTDFYGLLRIGGGIGGIPVGQLDMFFNGTLTFASLDGVSYRPGVQQ